ncbi:unnamed protein product [Paramecium octaurelia]|uniref:G domain-containing protein n=1 Tax=Paramecium octaurelia TaxID=43137 RepID=A0A8S1TJV6_PAROT|nr:unnamed protein product [Paramecium octaurelia]
MISKGSLDESQILQLIKSIQKLMNIYEQKMIDQPKILILVGVTGAGKSTVFNFLCGGNYELQEIKSGSQLILKENSEQFALQNGGMTSVTKAPNYYFDEKHNHLIIDFPGFKDPNGELDQILIQLLFLKIVSKSKVKLIYVLRHPETRFNERGVGLQDFIKILFQGQQVDLEKICLLLNCYGDKLPDQGLKESVKKQLQVIFKSDFKQISVLRKCKSPQDIEKIFSNEKRDQLIEELTQTQDIQFCPKNLQHSEKITKYLSDKNYQMYNGICENLNNQCKQKVDKLQERQLRIIKDLFEKLVTLLSNQNSKVDTQYANFIKLSQQIATQLNCQNDICSLDCEFSKIFIFFSQFEDLIVGYQNCLINQTLAYKSCFANLEIIKQQISILEKQKDLKQVESEKLNAIQQKQQAEYEFQIESQGACAAQQLVQNESNSKYIAEQNLTTIFNQKNNQQVMANNWKSSYSNLQQESQAKSEKLSNKNWRLQQENSTNQSQLYQKQLEIDNSQNQFEEQKRRLLSKLQDTKNQTYQLERQKNQRFE